MGELVYILSDTFQNAVSFMERNEDLVNTTTRRMILPNNNGLKILKDSSNLKMYVTKTHKNIESKFLDKVFDLARMNNIEIIYE